MKRGDEYDMEKIIIIICYMNKENDNGLWYYLK